MSILCCDKKVKTKFCPHCGKEVNGDSIVLAWIASCETALKYWVEMIASINGLVFDADPACKEETDKQKEETIKRLDKANKMRTMWVKRIEILKSTLKGSE